MGKEVFKLTLESLKNNVKTNSKDDYYRLNGFPYAFQVRFNECCPYLNEKYCQRSWGNIPCSLNWINDYLGRFEEFYTTLSLSSKKLELRELVATSKEIEKYRLDVIVAQDPNKESNAHDKGDRTVGFDDLSPHTIEELEVAMKDFDNKKTSENETILSPVNGRNESGDGLEDNSHVIKVVLEDIGGHGDAGDVVEEVVVDVNREVEVEERVASGVDVVESVKSVVGTTSNMTSNVVSGVAEVDAENAEHIVLEVARDIGKLELANETMDDVETAFQKTSSDYMRDAGVVASKVSVLRNFSSKLDLRNTIIPFPRRAIKRPCYLQSLFLQHFGSSSVETANATDVKKVVGICPLDDNIGKLPEMEMCTEYYS
ncbi:hypothetical protein ACET3Z_031514 [Daucus carota]